MTFIQFGSLTIPSVWIAVLLSLFIAPILFRGFHKKKVGDWYWSSFFIYFLTWKTSYILFNFQMFIDTPVSIIYFNGGVKGIILGLISLSLYLLFVARKKYPTFVHESDQVFLVFLLTYGLINSLVESTIIEAILYFIILSGYFLIIYFKKLKKEMNFIQVYMVIFLLYLLITSLFQTLFSLEVLNFAWIWITILILISKEGTKNYE